MVDVAMYTAGSKGFLKEYDRIPNIPTLDEARIVLMEMFDVRAECPEWNVKEATVNSSFTEGHVYGYCRDEHHMICVEDPGQQTTMEAWNERIKVRLELSDH